MASLINWEKPTAILKTRLINPLQRIQHALDRTMDDFEWPLLSERAFEHLVITPAIDIVDDSEHFKVEAEMPGMGERDIEVNIDDGILNIKGEKTTSKKDKDKNYLMREINYGCYERSIRLPDSVDLSQAKASFKKGMLWIDIPKKAEAVKSSKKLKVEAVQT